MHDEVNSISQSFHFRKSMKKVERQLLMSRTPCDVSIQFFIFFIHFNFVRIFFLSYSLWLRWLVDVRHQHHANDHWHWRQVTVANGIFEITLPLTLSTTHTCHFFSLLYSAVSMILFLLLLMSVVGISRSRIQYELISNNASHTHVGTETERKPHPPTPNAHQAPFKMRKNRH